MGPINRAVALWLVRKPDEYFDAWRVQASSGGGTIMINIVHEIDAFQYLLGPIREVKGEGIPCVCFCYERGCKRGTKINLARHSVVLLQTEIEKASLIAPPLQSMVNR
ncbi:hypothetical protein GRB70_39585 [Bradyrhizobium neotropicale]|nr:hypothetical protein [Bradyrhizobium neotropicale]